MIPPLLSESYRFSKQGGSEIGKLISASHLSWHFDPELTKHLSAKVSARSLGPIRLAWARVSSWAGERNDKDILASPEPYLTVIMPSLCPITLTTDDRSVEIGAFELGFWDSSQPIAFDIPEGPFEETSALIPQRLLRASSEACAALHGTRLEAGHILTEMGVNHMRTLSKYLEDDLLPYEFSVGAVTANLIDSIITSQTARDKRGPSLLFAIKEYIECYITDETLSAQTIADAFDVSVRHVYKLFEAEGQSVRRWVIRRRLERSAEDLRHGRLSITDIAFKWGFKDLGHYSRAFRALFDETPSAHRNAASCERARASLSPPTIGRPSTGPAA
ncbi:MAG: helix-turn-helix domain-containing protein [Pseudomonadota bacterium]